MKWYKLYYILGLIFMTLFLASSLTYNIQFIYLILSVISYTISGMYFSKNEKET